MRGRRDRAGLDPIWFDFDLTGHEPSPASPGTISLDGGTPTYRLLGRGAGAPGYDEADCLNLIQQQLGEDLPPVARSERQPLISDDLARQIGNPAWRGIWFPILNLSGPSGRGRRLEERLPMWDHARVSRMRNNKSARRTTSEARVGSS
jgi:hypothetical protein